MSEISQKKKYSHLRHKRFLLSIKTDIAFNANNKDQISKLDTIFKKIFMINTHEWLNVKEDNIDKNLKDVQRLAYIGATEDGLTIAQILVHAKYYDKLTINRPFIKQNFRENYPELNYKLEVQNLNIQQYMKLVDIINDSINKYYNKE